MNPIVENILQNKEITISISAQDIYKYLLSIIDSPHKELIAEKITLHLSSTELGISSLYKALRGVDDLRLDIMPGDPVLVEAYSISYYADKDLMEKEGMIKDKKFEAIVEEINPTNKYSIKVRYDILKSDGEKSQTTDWVNPDRVIPIKADTLDLKPLD